MYVCMCLCVFVCLFVCLFVCIYVTIIIGLAQTLIVLMLMSTLYDNKFMYRRRDGGMEQYYIDQSLLTAYVD